MIVVILIVVVVDVGVIVVVVVFSLFKQLLRVELCAGLTPSRFSIVIRIEPGITSSPAK